MRAALSWENQLLSVHPLKCVTECRAVVLLENIVTNLHDEVGPNAQYVCIERPMVDCAHRDSIGNDRFASIAVFLDMGRVKEFGVPQPAEGARAVIGAQHADPERGLMQTAFDSRLRVLAPEREIGWVKDLLTPLLAHPILERDNKLVLSWLLTDEPDGIHGHVNAWAHSQEPD